MTGFADTIAGDESPFLKEYQKPEPPKVREWYATQSQQAGLFRLNALADLFTRIGDSTPGSFRPLLRPLIIGATGTGKTSLAREFANQRGWSFLSCDAGSWIIQGSAPPKPPTLKIIRDHVRSAARTCILVDETCKLLPVRDDHNGGWYGSVFAEVLSLCDGDERLLGHEWRKDDICRLKNSCFLIFSGAFTSALREAKLSAKRGDLGFGHGESVTASHSSKIGEVLPDEIYSRFNKDHIVLQGPSRQDYARGIELIHADLKVERTTPIKTLLDEAEASKDGVRWLTDYLTRVLLANPEALPLREAQPPAPKPQGYDFFGPDTVYYCRQITAESFALRGVLARLFSDLRRFRGEIGEKEPRTFANWLFGASGDRVEIKLLNALCACGACADITADDSAVLGTLIDWREVAWDGLRLYAAELAHYEMLDLLVQSWDLASRVAELRAKMSSLVAAGRFGGQQS